VRLPRIRSAACPALLLLLVIPAAEATPPPGKALLIELPSQALALDVGAGGFVVVGGFNSGGGLTWMPTSGAENIGGLSAVAVSRDGKTIVGTTFNNRLQEAAIWQGGTTWRPLGSFGPNAQPCDLLLSSAYGASDDGKVVVGLGWDGCKFARAFRWEESTGMVDLGSTVSGRSSRANNVSGDGRVVVGWQEDTTGLRLGAKWVGGVQEVIHGPFGAVGEAFAVNRDGSIIAGTHCNFSDPRPNSWTWTASGGVQCSFVDVPRDIPDRFYSALMETTSDDGRVIGGALSFGLESQALVWFDGEVFFLKDYLRAHGVPDAFDGWINTGFVIGSTADGRTLVGYGAGPRNFQGYLVVLPELAKK